MPIFLFVTHFEVPVEEGISPTQLNSIAGGLKASPSPRDIASVQCYSYGGEPYPLPPPPPPTPHDMHTHRRGPPHHCNPHQTALHDVIWCTYLARQHKFVCVLAGSATIHRQAAHSRIRHHHLSICRAHVRGGESQPQSCTCDTLSLMC